MMGIENKVGSLYTNVRIQNVHEHENLTSLKEYVLMKTQ